MGIELSPAEEQRYRERVGRELLGKLRWAFLVAAVLFCLFTGMDLMMEPAILARNGSVRIGTVAAYLLLHMVSRRNQSPQWVDGLLLLGVAMGAASVTWLAAGMQQGAMLAVGALLLMVVIIAALISTLRGALAAYGVLLATINLLAWGLGAGSFFFFAVNVFVLSGTFAGALLAALSERSARRAFRLELDLEVLATRDSLTRAYNRGAFLQRSEEALALAARGGRPLSLLLLDIDRFKSINDTHGHPVGDEVIRTLASTCQATLRVVDVLGRLGGEEFAITLPETDGPGALRVAERLREAVAQVRVPVGATHLGFTVSIGVAIWTPGEPVDRLLSRADEALYAAKNSGRNRVCAAALAA
jgi:diguanylate cyclase (GGDEF)-like protein